ncbi:MAG: TauD/TfdA dioxygenase family protein [Lautropia sp.]
MTDPALPRLETRPLMPDFGIEILGVDVRDADGPTLQAVEAALGRHGAILLRGQSLSARDQLQFTSAFGAPAPNPRKEYVVPDFPEIYVISNRVENGRFIGEAEAGTAWHTDLNYAQRPAAYTFLHAIEVPAEGSDTLLADTCAAYRALPASRREQLQGLIVHHSYANLAIRARRELTDDEKRDYPDVFHPLVRTHPADGRKTLWGLSTTTPNGIVGLPQQEGKALIRELLAFATQERFVYRHRWQAGDLLVWDNRCTLHTGTPFDKQKYIRTMHRSWVMGEVPA